MCGIIGYTGQREASEVILEALRRLEYRGYDSAGIVIMNPGLTLHKREGELAEMQRTLPQINGHVGIGHTRWATCGKPSNENAHPFLDCHGRIALVHNGIIENYMALKEQLLNEGHVFTSQTDTEVIVHLIEKYDKGDLHQAVRAAVAEIKGTYAIACIETGSGQIVAARKENPLVLAWA
jgi:glucosamine--fructose-6-phosphate aminotransferase (isomerizing)